MSCLEAYMSEGQQSTFSPLHIFLSEQLRWIVRSNNVVAATSVVLAMLHCEFASLSARVITLCQHLTSMLPRENPTHVATIVDVWGRVLQLDARSPAVSLLLREQLRRAMEWLFWDPQSDRRLSAVMLLTFIAQHYPIMYTEDMINEALSSLWSALSDPSSITVRELAAEALAAVLNIVIDTEERDHEEQQPPEDEEASRESKAATVQNLFGIALNALRSGQDVSVHSSVLVIGVLLRREDHARYIPLRSCYEEVCDAIVHLRQTPLRFAIQSILPALAKYDPAAFLARFLGDSIRALLTPLGKSTPTVAEKSAALLILGKLVANVGLESVLHSYMNELILPFLRSALQSKPRVDAAMTCLALFVEACPNELKQDMIPISAACIEIPSATPLSAEYSTSLARVTTVLYPLLPMARSRLLDEIVVTLAGKSSHRRSYPDGTSLSTRSITQASPIFDEGGSVEAKQSCFKALRSFDFAGHSFGSFFEETCVEYFNHPDCGLRREAVKACVTLLLSDCPDSERRSDGSMVHTGQSHVEMLSRVVLKLLHVSVCDVEADIRRDALESLTQPVDQFLTSTAAFQCLFSSLNDSDSSIRFAAVQILDRVVHRNPSIAYPHLRKLQLQLIGELQFMPIVSAKNKENHLRMLQHIIHCAPRHAQLYIPTLVEEIYSTLNNPASSSVACGLALSITAFLVGQSYSEDLPKFKQLLPLIVSSVSSDNDRRALPALMALQSIVQSGGSEIMEGHCTELVPQLQVMLLPRRMLDKQMAIAAMRLLGAITATATTQTMLTLNDDVVELEPLLPEAHSPPVAVIYVILQTIEKRGETDDTYVHCLDAGVAVLRYSEIFSLRTIIMQRLVPAMVSLLKLGRRIREHVFLRFSTLIDAMASQLEPLFPTIRSALLDSWPSDCQEPALISRMCDVVIALNRQRTEPLRPMLTRFLSNITNNAMRLSEMVDGRDTVMKLFAALDSFNSQLSDSAGCILFPQLSQLLTIALSEDVRARAAQTLTSLLYLCSGAAYVSGIVDACTNLLRKYHPSADPAIINQYYPTSGLAGMHFANDCKHPDGAAASGEEKEELSKIPWSLDELEAVGCLCAVAARCSETFSAFHAAVAQLLVEKWPKKLVVVRFFNSCFRKHSATDYHRNTTGVRAAGSSPPPSAEPQPPTAPTAPIPIGRLPLAVHSQGESSSGTDLESHKNNPERWNLVKSLWVLMRRNKPNEWRQWLEQFALELLKVVSSRALRDVVPLVQCNFGAMCELLPMTFVSCLMEMDEGSAAAMLGELKHLETLQSCRIPPDVLLVLAHIAHYVRLNASALGTLSNRVTAEVVSQLALRARDMPLAIFYVEQLLLTGHFEQAPTLASLYTSVHLRTLIPSVTASEYCSVPHMSSAKFLEGTHQWATAKALYFDQLHRDIHRINTGQPSPNVSLSSIPDRYFAPTNAVSRDAIDCEGDGGGAIVIPDAVVDRIAGYMRCLNATFAFEEVLQVWADIPHEARTSMRIAEQAARAAQCLGHWDALQEAAEASPACPRTMIYLADVAAFRKDYPKLEIIFEKLRERLIQDANVLLSYDFQRAFELNWFFQHMSELEEGVEQARRQERTQGAHLIRGLDNRRLPEHTTVEERLQTMTYRSLIVTVDKQTALSLFLCRGYYEEGNIAKAIRMLDALTEAPSTNGSILRLERFRYHGILALGNVSAHRHEGETMLRSLVDSLSEFVKLQRASEDCDHTGLLESFVLLMEWKRSWCSCMKANPKFSEQTTDEAFWDNYNLGDQLAQFDPMSPDTWFQWAVCVQDICNELIGRMTTSEIADLIQHTGSSSPKLERVTSGNNISVEKCGRPNSIINCVTDGVRAFARSLEIGYIKLRSSSVSSVAQPPRAGIRVGGQLLCANGSAIRILTTLCRIVHMCVFLPTYFEAAISIIPAKYLSLTLMPMLVHSMYRIGEEAPRLENTLIDLETRPLVRFFKTLALSLAREDVDHLRPVIYDIIAASTESPLSEQERGSSVTPHGVYEAATELAAELICVGGHNRQKLEAMLITTREFVELLRKFHQSTEKNSILDRHGVCPSLPWCPDEYIVSFTKKLSGRVMIRRVDSGSSDCRLNSPPPEVPVDPHYTASILLSGGSTQNFTVFFRFAERTTSGMSSSRLSRSPAVGPQPPPPAPGPQPLPPPALGPQPQPPPALGPQPQPPPTRTKDSSGVSMRYVPLDFACTNEQCCSQAGAWGVFTRVVLFEPVADFCCPLPARLVPNDHSPAPTCCPSRSAKC